MERVTCSMCDALVRNDGHIETDPRTNETLYVCGSCRHIRSVKRERLLYAVYHPDYDATLRVYEIARHAKPIYEVVFHSYYHVERKRSYNGWGGWIRDAFIHMEDHHG